MGYEMIEDQERLKYKRRLEEFSQKINPKPDKQTIELLKQQYLNRRNSKIYVGVNECDLSSNP